MHQHQHKIDTALLAGDWDRFGYEAGVWVRTVEAAGEKDPCPYFALNVTHLLRGEFADAWRVHAHALQETADIDRVGDWLAAILKQHPDNAHVNLVQGMFLAQSGQSEQSVVFYKEAAKLAPQSAYPHYFLAQIHERAAHLEMAIKEYREAVKLDPSFAAARTNLGVAYQEQGRLEMAIPQYREVIKLNPNDALAHANLGCALAEQGKVEPALQSYKEALRLNP
ncbi:MAG TPA: tetratricopeptide repeat protein, partial [Nitrospira sp.]|nr:tetratricopeptide repeat protein [Nitrospira sp.]